MLTTHIASFLQLIDTVLADISRGIASSHHLHNVRCGIENILGLLEYNDELVQKADQLSRRAGDYIKYHDVMTSQIAEATEIEDVSRLHIAREALATFRSALERSRPNRRVRTLGLA